MGGVFSKLEAITPGQEEIVKAFSDQKYEIIGLFGPTGSGKSLFSIAYGIDSVLTGRYKRFVISRPVIDVATGRELTAADIGELYYQVASNYLRDILEGLVDWTTIEELMKTNKIVIADTHYLRGRTFDNSVIFLDDAQSIPVESALEIIMRVGKNSRLIIAGDPVFQRTTGSRDSASLLREILLGEEDARVIDLGLKDIVRPGAKRGIRLLLESIMRSRPLEPTEKEILDVSRVYAPDAEIVTVIDLTPFKKKHNIKAESAPDALIVAKEGFIGRVIGKNGERISKIESETGRKVRAVEASLELRVFVRALHPVSWIIKHIEEVDFAGPNLVIKVHGDAYGAFVGTKGSYVRFLEDVFRKLLGVGVRAIEIEEKKKSKE